MAWESEIQACAETALLLSPCLISQLRGKRGSVEGLLLPQLPRRGEEAPASERERRPQSRAVSLPGSRRLGWLCAHRWGAAGAAMGAQGEEKPAWFAQRLLTLSLNLLSCCLCSYTGRHQSRRRAGLSGMQGPGRCSRTFTLLMPTHWLGSVRAVLSSMQPLSPIRPAASRPPPTAVRCRVCAAWLAGAEGCPLWATRGVLGAVGTACTLLSDPRLAPRRIGSAARRGRPCVVRTSSWPGSWQSPLDSGQTAG